MIAIVRVMPEEVIEEGGCLVDALTEVELCHRQLILIGEEYAFADAFLLSVNDACPLIDTVVVAFSF